VQSMQ